MGGGGGGGKFTFLQEKLETKKLDCNWFSYLRRLVRLNDGGGKNKWRREERGSSEMP